MLEIYEDSEFDKIQLYFFADMCFKMNLDCKCSNFTSKTVSNLIKILTKGDKIDVSLKAGLARILNTILTNKNDSISTKPNFLRVYGK